MENTPTPNNEFEKFIRKNLQQVDASPDDDLWDKIAAEQAKPNTFLRRRKYALPAAAGVLLFAVLLCILYFRRPALVGAPATENSGAGAAQAENTVMQPTAATSAQEMPAQEIHAATKTAVIPHFGPRVNAVPGQTLSFSAESGVSYKNPVTGTSVSIPAGSLVDQNGATVRGEVELLFREYRTIEEFLASGIPMHYTDNRGDYSFNSGGMFEMRVSQNGNLLNMAPGQNYKVNFVPTADLENAGLYYLDDKTGAWDFVPSAAFNQAELTQPPIVSQTTAISNNLKDKSSDCKPESGMIAQEPDPVELVQLGVKTGLELATGKLTMPTWFLKNPYLTDEQLLFRMERGLIRIKKHRDQAQLFFPEDLNNFFTELAAFKNCYFAYNIDSLSGSRNMKGVTDGDYWQRITVAQVKGAECVITLFDGKEGQVQFHALLTGSTENKHFDSEKVIKEYDRLRRQRQQDFAEKNKSLRFFLYASSAFKTPEEWCYSAWQWLDYFENNHSLMAKRYGNLVKEGLSTNPALAAQAWKKWQQLLREQRFARDDSNSGAIKTAKTNLEYSLQLSRFGVYNCDQIFRLGGDGSLFVYAGYQTPEGKKVIPASVALMEYRTKVYITLPSAAKLLWSPGRQIDVVITDRDGRQYHLSREKYTQWKVKKDDLNLITVQDVTDKTVSPKAWADLLEI